MLLDTARFPLLAWLEDHAPTIRSEANRIPLDRAEPYRQVDAYVGSWLCFPLVLQPHAHEVDFDDVEARRLAPRSMALLNSRPEILTAGISIMLPGTHIMSHVDDRPEGVLRAHLGLEIPRQSALRVGPCLAHWEDGKTLIFDGRIDHETVNTDATARVVLLVDFYLTKAEQAYLDQANLGVDSSWLIAGAGAKLFSGAEL